MKTSEYLWIKGQLTVFLIKNLLIGIGIFTIASTSIYALFWFFDLNSDLLTFLYVLTSGTYIVINSAIILHKHDAKVKKLLEFYNSFHTKSKTFFHQNYVLKKHISKQDYLTFFRPTSYFLQS